MVQTTERSTFLVLFTTVFLDFLGFALILPYIFFYAESFGASPLVYGLLLSSYSLAQFVFTPIWGNLSDRFGRRKIILACLMGSGLSYMIFGLATNLSLLFFSRIASGAMAATFPVAGAYIADITTPETRFLYMGRIGAAFGLGMIIGPAIGGTLSGLYGYAVPSLLAATIAFSNLALGYLKLPESLINRQVNSKRESLVSTFKSAEDIWIWSFPNRSNIFLHRYGHRNCSRSCRAKACQKIFSPVASNAWNYCNGIRLSYARIDYNA